MARLILLNGPPASGKSTLARRYAEEHPLTLVIDIDQVRGSIGGWQQDRHHAGLLARGVALAAARAHLTAGHDVIVPQLVARPDFIDQLGSLASEVMADFHEVALQCSLEQTMARWAGRRRQSTDPSQRAVDDDLARRGAAGELAELHARLASLLSTRPAARSIAVEAADVEAAYQQLTSLVGTHPR